MERTEGVTQLRIAAGLGLPLDFATKTAAILAQRRKGKTYAASVIAEEMVAAKQPFVALDPTGAWWGLRAAADGKSEGLPVIVLGGQHGDVPLDRTAGRLIADLVVDEPGYYVIDFSLFESGEAERQFAVDFAERLYRAKGQPGKDFPLHLFVDEADRFVPQQLRKGSNETSPRLLGAFEAIVRRGGLRGLGTTLISQRAAVVNKNVLEMLDILIALRTIGPNDRDAVAGYVKAHGTKDELDAMMGSLASLEIGEAWIWEPGAEPPLFRRIRIRQRHTFNSSATPKAGEKRAEPKRLAAVDLASLQKRMAETIEKAKADDPRELRKRIAELERSIKTAPKIVENRQADTKPAVKIQEKLVVTDAQLAHLDRQIAAVEKLADRMSATVTSPVAALRQQLSELSAAVKTVRQPALPLARPAAPVRSTPVPQNRPINGVRSPSVMQASASGGVTPAKQKILNGLAFLHGIGLAQADKTQLALIVGVSPTSGGYFNNLGSLRSDGLIEYPSGGTVALTDAGRAIASTDGVPSTTDELHDAIRAKLPPAKWRIVETLIAAYPNPLPKDDLAERIGVSPTSGGFFNNLGSLRSLGLIDYPQPGAAAALPVLFLEG